MNTKIKHILKPLKLGKITLRSRVLMGSMHTGLEEEKNGFEKLAKFYVDRVKGGVGLIVTGGISPDFFGRIHPFASTMATRKHAKKHRIVTDAVHKEGGHICMQILHTGRYGYHPFLVAPSPIKAPINIFKPWPLPNFLVEKTIRNYVRCAKLAKDAGYDGVEIMGSEGYLINQFLAKRTNKRRDKWGGEYEARANFAIEIVKRMREVLPSDFIIIFRLSLIDLVTSGSTFSEVVSLAKSLEKEGVSLINSGIGWHESKVPTIASMVPRGAFSWITEKIKNEVKIPIVASNRINDPSQIEDILRSKKADMVSMARPLLADPFFVKKVKEDREDEINTCIGCNQACLDHVFKKKRATCLVNPRACYEMDLPVEISSTPKKVAIIGAGPAGLSCAVTASERGHKVTLFEKSNAIGGQFNLAKKVYGKEEFRETLRYFARKIQLQKIDLRLNHKIDIRNSALEGFDVIVVATGIVPRFPKIPGIKHPKVINYLDILERKKVVDGSVAIIGAGGIGFDTALFITSDNKADSRYDYENYYKEWGIDKNFNSNGGLVEGGVSQQVSSGNVYLLQRTKGKVGKGLGKTTGWIHRSSLLKKGVKMISGVTYEKIDDAGLRVSVDGTSRILPVDNIIVCAGQLSDNAIYEELVSKRDSVYIIGGAKDSNRLDAKVAIRQGFKLGLEL